MKNLQVNQLKEEKIILAHSLMLDHGLLAQLLWAGGHKVCHGTGRCSSHGDQEAKRDRNRQSQYPLKATPPAIPLLPSRPHLLKVLPFPDGTIGWGPNSQHMYFWGTLRIPAITCQIHQVLFHPIFRREKKLILLCKYLWLVFMI